MGKIKLLSEDVVNKIAAGEVVERPANVLKELLDNAYDAGATTIIVDIEKGGIKKIQVIDNGEGMDEEDVKNAFKPHATSKISQAEDLLNIKKYGFRGEALSSIASVSKVTLKSRQKNASLGTEIKIEGGKVISTTAVGAQVGTSVLVEDLFYNVPARKEFLKSEQSEYRAILNVVEAYAIANPEVGINLINNGKEIYNMYKDEKIEDRIREVKGADFTEKLIPIFFEHPHIEIYGLVGKPEQATERRKNQYIFVNKRNVSNNQIAFAVKQAYKSLIPNNTYPPFFIFIDIQPNIVDVNVHPRKEEVRFTDDKFIFTSIKTAVEKALDRTDLTPGTPKSAMFGQPSTTQGMAPFSTPKPTFSNPLGRSPITKSSSMPGKSLGTSFPKTAPRTQSGFKPPAASRFGDPFDNFFSAPGNIPSQDNTKKVLQVHNLYLVTQSESGIIIYDQHAVHERVIYERLIKAHGKEKTQGATQPLLTPVVIDLTVSESEVFDEYKKSFEEAGFKIEEFGKTSYKITEIPSALSERNLNDLFHELLSDLESDQKMKETDTKTNKMLKYLACRSAYKAGDPMPHEEAVALINALEKTDIQYTCPHGRPVKVEITLKELSKMFKRTK